MYVICSERLLVARLRTANHDASGRTVEVLEWLTSQIRAARPHVRIAAVMAPVMAGVHLQYLETGRAARVFADFPYQTRDSWSRVRRVVDKAENLAKGPNLRLAATSLPAAEREARALHEENYCTRGEMENRIKEQQLMPFADRTSTAWLRSDQLQLWFR